MLRKLGASLLCLALVSCEPSATPMSTAAVTHDYPEIQEVVSDSGMKAWLVEDHSLPLVAFRVVFKEAGSAYDPDGKEGRAMLTMALLDEGAGERDSLAFTETLENHAIRLGFNAHEDYSIAKGETLSEHLELAFSLLGDALIRPRFTPTDIERLRRDALVALTRAEQSPYHHLWKTAEDVIYGAHPYGKEEDGTEASLRALTKSDLETFRKRYITRQNAQISIVGDVTPAEVKRLLDKHLAALPATYDPEITIPQAEWPEQPAPRHVEMDIPQTVVLIAYPGIERTHPDYFTAYTLNHMIGGDTLTGRLGKAVREDKGLAYGASSWLQPMLHDTSWNINFATRGDRTQEAIGVTQNVLEQVRRYGEDAESLAHAKSYLSGAFILNLDTNGEVAAFLSTLQLFGLERDYMEKRDAMLEAVTLEDIKRIASQLINDDKRVVVTVGKDARDGE